MTQISTFNVTVLRDVDEWSATVHHDGGEHDTFSLSQRGEVERVVREAMADRLGHDQFRLDVVDCFRCDAVYRRGNSEAEVEAEKQSNYPDDPDPDEDYASVCDGCYDRLMAMGGPR